MSNRMCAVALVGVIAAALLVGAATVSFGAASNTVYVPMMREARATLSIEHVAQLPMPFSVLNGVEPIAVQTNSGIWLITVFRLSPASKVGQWIVQWDPRNNSVAEVAQLGANSLNGVQPVDGPLSNARGALACSIDGHVYHFSWFVQGNDQHNPLLNVHLINGDNCQ